MGKTECLTLQIIGAHTDAAGVVYHARFLEFFEASRWNWFHTYALPDRVHFLFENLAIVHVECEYLSPACFPDVLSVTAQPSRVTIRSFTFDYNVTRESVLVATGKSVHVLVDKYSKKAIELPGDVRALLEG